MKYFKLLFLSGLILVSGLVSCGSGSNNPASAGSENSGSENSTSENSGPLGEEDDPLIVQEDGPDEPIHQGPALAPNAPPIAGARPPEQAVADFSRFAPPRIDRFRMLNYFQHAQRSTWDNQPTIIENGVPLVGGGEAEVGVYFYPIGRNVASSPTLEIALSPAGSEFQGSVSVEGPIAFRHSNQSPWDYDFQRWTPAWNNHNPRRTLLQISGANLQNEIDSEMRVCPAPVHLLATPERYYLHRPHPLVFDNGLDYAEFTNLLLPENQCPVFRLEEAWNALPHLYSEISFLYVLRVLDRNGNILEERQAELLVNFECGKWEYQVREERGHYWNITTSWSDNHECLPVF